MIKKGNISLLISVIFLIGLLFGVSGVLAVSGVNIGITGTIGDYSDEVVLITDSSATTGVDAYDLPEQTPPSDYSSFYSSISGGTLAIDSWDEAARSNINLTYDIPDGTSGDLEISWDDIGSGADYTATFTITGLVTNHDMKSDVDNKYIYSGATDGQDVTIYVTIGNVASATTETASSSGGGGGGGGASPSKDVNLPPINVIQDAETGLLLFDTEVLIPQEYKDINEGDTLRASINLDPQIISGNLDLDVQLKYYIVDLSTGSQVNVGEGESGWVRVTGTKTISKSFFTSTLPPGSYELTMELKYCTLWKDGECKSKKEEVIASTSQFNINSITGKGVEAGILSALTGYRTILLFLGIGIIVLILFIIVLIRSTGKLKKRKRK